MPCCCCAVLQLVLEYIDKKTRAMQQQNKIAAWAMCIVRGLMWLLEKIVAFINRNAFILVAGKTLNFLRVGDCLKICACRQKCKHGDFVDPGSLRSM